MRWLRTFLAGGLVVAVAGVVPPSGAGAQVAAVTPPTLWTESSYASVFKDSGPSPEASDRLRLDTAKNDFEAAQVVVRSGSAFTVNGVDFTALAGPSDTISAAELSFNPVGYEYLNHNSVFGSPAQPVYPTIRTGAGDYPDRLLNQSSIAVPANTTQSIWIRVHVPATAAGGVYTGQATVRTTAGDLKVALSVNARNVVIPPAKDSEFTNTLWTNFFAETIKDIYGHDRYSAGWWQLIDNWADNMVKYRTNTLPFHVISLLQEGGSTVDSAGKYTFNWSRVDQVVERFLAKGAVKRIEGLDGAGPHVAGSPKWYVPMIAKVAGQPASDFATWDSAEANNWYAQFYPALKAHLEAKGWADKWWMHVGDEPGGVEGRAGWFGIAAKARQYWPGITLGDAVVHELAPEVAKSADIVIPSTFTYTIDPSPFDAELAKGKPMWFYNANIPVGNHLNRFIDQPEWSQRQTMWLAYGRGATGYLHWAYNYWGKKIDDQDVKGDPYIVRPDVAHNTIEATPRYESLRDGMEDWEVLNKLGKNNPGLAKKLATSLVERSDKYSPDVSYMQRIRAIALDAAAGLPVVAKDLATARPATASTQQTGSEAAKVVDGNNSTGWQPTTGTGTQWVQVDLGRQAQVDGVRLHWGSVFATNYKVQLSYNGTDWSDKSATSSGRGGDDFIGVNGKTRYIRVEVTAGSGGATPYQLTDLEVAGNALLQQNLAGGKPYTATTPSAQFPDAGREATDGVLANEWAAGRDFGYEVANGSQLTANVSIDLGYPQSVGLVRIHAYEENPDYLPDMINVQTSNDGVNYTSRGLLSWLNGASRLWYDVGFAPVTARFVRVTFDKKGTAGGNRLFLDDIEAYGTGPGGPDVVPGSAAFQWSNQEIVFAPSTTATMRRWNWTPGVGTVSADWGGGPIAGKPSGFAWNNQQHAVARGQDGKLLHWWWIDGETAPHYANWGGDAASDPTTVVWGGQQQIFTRSSTGDLSHWWWDPADAQLRTDTWKGAPGPIVGSPSTYVWGNQLHVVARGADNHLYHWWWITGEFEPHFADWGGEVYSDPTTFTWNGQQHVFTKAADGNVFHWWWDPADGQLRTDKWTGAPAAFSGSPAGFKYGTMQHVYARGAGNSLYHWWWDQATGLVKFEDKGGEAYSDPVVFGYGDQQQIFAQSATNTLYHWWHTPQDGWHLNDWGGSVKYPGQ
ncbi:MAG: hypothetical protein QOG10_40 [Kribbellaceae bacterium]|nr:hypothetical protein [Kribbellaceae bacterium]